MARVKITEYRAKKILDGDAYRGIAIGNGALRLPKTGRFVVKVDQGIKKRFKQGLVAVDRPARDIPKLCRAWKKKGFSRFLAEPYIPHAPEEERYLSLERVRGGIRLLAAAEGGVDIETHPEKVRMFLMRTAADCPAAARAAELPERFLARLFEAFEQNFFSFLEINPLIIRGDQAFLLDAAVLADSAGMFFTDSWGEEDIVEANARHPREEAVRALQKTTPASLKLTVMNPDGSIFFLLSGGGGSIVIADEAHLKGAGKQIGNYGEYSGGPTREETHLYAREILRLLLGSKAKKKALVIAGGVANFTDISSTFAGIIDAFEEVAEPLRAAGVKVFVRRGGPNEAAGLRHMEDFLKARKLFGSMHGSDAPITAAIDEAVEFARA